MQQGFYWVERNGHAPEIWYFADGEGGGWYHAGEDVPQHPDDFVKQGYHVISERLEPPSS